LSGEKGWPGALSSIRCFFDDCSFLFRWSFFGGVASGDVKAMCE
jgi:hypothetical protein